MRLLSWNVRGLNAPNKHHLVKRGMELSKVDIFLVQETKLTNTYLEMFEKKKKGWHVIQIQATEASGGISQFWKPQSVQIYKLVEGLSWLGCKVKSIYSNLQFGLINVYRSNSYIRKRGLWLEIENFLKLHQNVNFTIVGDFNAILNSNDKQGGIRRENQSQKDFKEWLERN